VRQADPMGGENPVEGRQQNRAVAGGYDKHSPAKASTICLAGIVCIPKTWPYMSPALKRSAQAHQTDRRRSALWWSATMGSLRTPPACGEDPSTPDQHRCPASTAILSPRTTALWSRRFAISIA
jgi:hypothetical protein